MREVNPFQALVGQMTMQQYAAIHFAGQWVKAIAATPGVIERREDIALEANRLGNLQAHDLMLTFMDKQAK